MVHSRIARRSPKMGSTTLHESAPAPERRRWAKRGRLPFVTRSSTLGLLVEVLLVLLGLGTILGGVSVFATCCIVAWIVLALIYVAIILWFAWCVRLVPDQTDTQETALVLPSWLVFLLGWTPVIAAFMGLIGGLTEQVSPDQIADQITQLLTADRDTALRIARVAIDAVTVLMAVLGWSLLHMGYARHYERLDHLYGSAIEFPGTKDAELTDYMYFAITIGTTFATSDVNVVSRRLRWTVATHSVLAFFYNAIVMAIAFKILTD